MTVCLEAQSLAPETLLLARIKSRMAENLSRLPNYTCLQTVERSVREAGSKRFRLLDKLRLEVAFVGGKELYAWPGEDKFEGRDFFSFAPNGAMSSGSFALHAKDVFLTEEPTFQYDGQHYSRGREVHRFSYTVPQFRSRFRIRAAGREVIVGYRGSFTVDAKSLDLVRLEVVPVEVPASLRLRSSSEVMEYRTASFGAFLFLLPFSSELTMTDLTGRVSSNRIAFDSCHQYAGESVISFADPAALLAAPVKRVKIPTQLPPDLEINVRLDSPIVFGESAMGDLVTATVQSPAKAGETEALPKGAKITGRITRLQYVGSSHYAIAIDFTSAEAGGIRMTMASRIDPARKSHSVLQFWPDRKTFLMRSPGRPLKLPRGYMIILRTMKSNSGVGE